MTAVALWLNAGPESPPRPLRRFAIELDHAVGEAVISPNGRYIAYTRCRSSIHGFGSLWVRDLKTGRTANLVEAPVVRHIAWSPTSDFVAYGTSYGRVKSVQKSAAPNGPSIKLSDLPTGLTGCAWSPDGESILLAVARSRTLFTIPARGGALSPFIELSGLGPRDQFFHPAWIQDDSGGSAVIGSQGSPRGEDIEGLEMVLYRPGTGTDPEELAEGFAPAYSPSGHLVYLNAAAGLMALPFSTASMAAAGERFPIAAAEGPQGASITADGAMVYVRVRERGREQLVWRDRQGKKLAAVGQPQFYVAQPQLSPDGRRAITVGGTHWGESIWMQDLDTQEASRLTFSKELDFCPVWSPDGRRLLHRSSESGNGDLYLRNADGSGSATKVLATERSEQPWDWSPDGRYILYGTPSKPTMQDVYYLELESDGRWSAPKTFVSTAGHERAAQFSPDGRFVAYVSDESGRDEVYVRSFPSGDGQRQVSRNGGAQPRWNPNGGELFYVEADALIAVSVQTRAGFSTGKAQALFRDRGLADLNLSHTYDVSPDGRRFVMVDWMANPQFSIEIVQNWYEEFREQERAATVR